MSKLFLSILNMSIAASWIVLAVLVLRFLLKKAPKWITVLLWAVVAVRLICPLAIESKVSLIPSAQTVSPGIMMDRDPKIYTGIPAVNNSINPIIGAAFAPSPGTSMNPLQFWIPLAAGLWGIGAFALFFYGIISYVRIKKRISAAVLLRDKVYQSENVSSPFVLGMIRPKIYLPFSMTGAEMLHVIAHEEAHIRRKDHWWKPIGFAVLSLHWFNPLMWLAYVLLCRDIEMACDQKVVKTLNAEERADYSQALLNCSVGRKLIASCPLAFGEVGVKDRVRSVLSYKKPCFWLLLAGIGASMVLAVCFLTNPSTGKLGTLENLEFITLTGRVENTACVWVSDGFSYERVGKISEDLLRDLADIKTSKEEISLNRSEDRDKSHTIILQNANQAGASLSSYIDGLYIHFNSDFTSVWINNNVKPTLSYRVMEPEKAKEVYENLSNYNVSAPAETYPSLSPEATNISSLKEKFPAYFDLGTFKGLEIYVWQMAENAYSCGVLQGVNRNYSQGEIWALHENPASLEEMQAIIAYYLEEGLAVKEDITLVPVTMPHSSYYYTIDDAYKAELNDLFWSGFSDNNPSNTEPDYSSFIFDEGIFDIDGDGKEEHCFMGYGPTSGIFTFTITAFEDGEPEYFNIFTCPWTTLSFGITAEGQGILAQNDDGTETFLSLGIEDGNIVIFSDTQEMEYWGQQGLDSPLASGWIAKPEAGYLDSGQLETIHGNFRTYYRNADGTWQYNGYLYKYRLVLTGRTPNATVDTTYVYLSNLQDISFERAMWASGLSSQTSAYFSPEEAVLVEIYTGEAVETTTPTGYPSETIGQPQIMYNGMVYYYFATGFDKPLPEGYEYVGAVADVDHTMAPVQNFHGARVEAGQEIYALGTNPDSVYLKYESGYAEFSARES